MGLFSFVGKVLGGAARVAANLATGNPLGAFKAGVSTIGSLAGHKSVSPTVAQKFHILGRMPVTVSRGNGTQSTPGIMGPVERRLSPVLPGGAVATRNGPAAASSSTPPRTYGGQRKKKRTSSKRRSTTRSTRKRRGGGRKLKFGSPAWRKKYMRGGAKKRRRKS